MFELLLCHTHTHTNIFIMEFRRTRTAKKKEQKQERRRKQKKKLAHENSEMNSVNIFSAGRRFGSFFVAAQQMDRTNEIKKKQGTRAIQEKNAN